MIKDPDDIVEAPQLHAPREAEQHGGMSWGGMAGDSGLEGQPWHL